MAPATDHYDEAQRLLTDSHGVMADDLEPGELLTAILAEAQVRATLALADATAGRRWPLVWQLDDGSETSEPDLYVTRSAAELYAILGYKRDNPFTEPAVADLKWRRVKDEDHASELMVKDRPTGIIVRGIRPKAGA